MKKESFTFIWLAILASFWLFDYEPILGYWFMFLTFFVIGLAIIDGPNIRAIDRLLFITKILILIKVSGLTAYWSGLLENSILTPLFPWSVALSLVITLFCLFFGYIGRYNTVVRSKISI